MFGNERKSLVNFMSFLCKPEKKERKDRVKNVAKFSVTNIKPMFPAKKRQTFSTKNPPQSSAFRTQTSITKIFWGRFRLTSLNRESLNPDNLLIIYLAGYFYFARFCFETLKKYPSNKHNMDLAKVMFMPCKVICFWPCKVKVKINPGRCLWNGLSCMGV